MKIVNFKLKTDILLIALILLFSAGLRLYRINEFMTFLGDEGRDVLVVKRIIVDLKPTLLGPITSVGSIYMGPVYYYMMAPFLWLFRLSPVGPSVMVALSAVFTVYVVYRIGRDFFGHSTGLIAALFYTLSPLTITYGRSSWNPNVVPLYASLLMYGVLMTVVRGKFRWLILSGFCLGILIQLHYITFLFFPVIFACLAIIGFRVPFGVFALSLAAFLAAYSPFLAFELRHDFVNLQGALHFISQQQTGSALSSEAVIKAVSDVFVRLFWRVLVIENAEWTKAMMVGIAAALFAYWRHIRANKEKKRALLVLLLWFFVGLFGYGAYHGIIYDYYMGSLFPVPFLFFGIAIEYCLHRGTWGKTVAMAAAGLLVIFSIRQSPLRITPNNMLANTQTIAQYVHQQTAGKRYNFALIAGKNSDHAYSYFLEIWGNPPVTIENPVIDPSRETVMEELWVVCEEKVCAPLGHPLWQIAGFGPAEIVGEWEVSTARIFKLVHYNGTSLN